MIKELKVSIIMTSFDYLPVGEVKFGGMIGKIVFWVMLNDVSKQLI